MLSLLHPGLLVFHNGTDFVIINKREGRIFYTYALAIWIESCLFAGLPMDLRAKECSVVQVNPAPFHTWLYALI